MADRWLTTSELVTFVKGSYPTKNPVQTGKLVRKHIDAIIQNINRVRVERVVDWIDYVTEIQNSLYDCYHIIDTYDGELANVMLLYIKKLDRFLTQMETVHQEYIHSMSNIIAEVTKIPDM